MTEISQITSENFEGEVGTITIVGNLGTGQRVVISVPAEAVVVEGKSSISIASDVATVEISEDAEGAKVEVGKNATVENVVADAKASITGSGTVEKLEANASGITVNKNLNVDKTETAAGVSKPTTGSTSGGGGGSSSGSHGGNTGGGNTGDDNTGGGNTGDDGTDRRGWQGDDPAGAGRFCSWDGRCVGRTGSGYRTKL